MNHDRRYPLCWPDGWKRAPNRSSAPYKVSEEKAKNDLLHAVKLLGGRNIILSTNIALRQDGLPYANQKTPADPGVAIYFTRKGKEQVIACDRWTKVGDNYRAIWMAIEAMRSIERCGASELLDRAFAGFAALPAAGESAPLNWRIELDLPEVGALTKDRIEEAYRTLAKTRHPDVPGGSNDAFIRLTQARDAALKEIR